MSETNPSYLTADQISHLLNPVNPLRVQRVNGQSNMAAYDIRAHLTRIFGFGRWSSEVISMELIYEQQTTTKNGKDAYDVGYRAGVQLTIKAPDGTELARFTEYAVGAHIQPAYMRGDLHDFAMKTAESQALKRAAMNLGDQFGLSLYNKGSLAPLVMGTLVWPTTADASADLPETEEQLNEETDPDVVIYRGDTEDQPRTGVAVQQPQAAPQQQAQQPQAAPQAQTPQQAPSSPQEAAQPPALDQYQAEVKEAVGFLTDETRAQFRQAWKKAGLPAGYQNLGPEHIQWIWATLDDLQKSTAVDKGVDNGGEPPAALDPALDQQTASASQILQRRREVEQAERAFYGNRPGPDAAPEGDPYYS